jgi:hypothetical protein
MIDAACWGKRRGGNLKSYDAVYSTAVTLGKLLMACFHITVMGS